MESTYYVVNGRQTTNLAIAKDYAAAQNSTMRSGFKADLKADGIDVCRLPSIESAELTQ